MINFIVVDDNKKFLDIMSDFITKTMMSNKFVYKTHKFVEYDSSFYDIMNSNVELSVLLQIIDDTNSQFQRRNNIFDKTIKYIGINVGRVNESLFCYYLLFGKDI